MTTSSTHDRVWAAISRRPDASVRELAAELDLAISTVSYWLTVLDREGMISVTPRAARARRVNVWLHLADMPRAG